MDSKAAQSLCEEYQVIYEEKIAENCINQEKFFINAVEVVHLAPFNDTSYEVMVYTIKEGKIIPFKLQNAIRLFGSNL
ncbi:MAG TPA: hypothetical protein VGC65_04470 [Bacteroidia bacterium]|jgi:hypothetical protein